MTETQTKREILRKMLDDIEPGWDIIKPSAVAPNSLDPQCIFYKGLKRAEVSIEFKDFQYPSEWPQIKELIRQEIAKAT